MYMCSQRRVLIGRRRNKEKTSLVPEIKTGFQVPNVSEKEYGSAKKS